MRNGKQIEVCEDYNTIKEKYIYEFFLGIFFGGGGRIKRLLASSCPCVLTEPRDCHWTDFHVRVISYLEFSLNLSVSPDFDLNRATVTFCSRTSAHFCHVNGLCEPLFSVRYVLGQHKR